MKDLKYMIKITVDFEQLKEEPTNQLLEIENVIHSLKNKEFISKKLEITNFMANANNKINDYMQKTEKFDTEIDYISKKHHYSDKEYQNRRSIFISHKDKFIEKLKAIKNIDDYTGIQKDFYWLASYFNSFNKQFYVCKIKYLAKTLSNLIDNGIIQQEQVNQLIFHGYEITFTHDSWDKDEFSFEFYNGVNRYNIYGIGIKNELEELTNFLVQFIMNLK